MASATVGLLKVILTAESAEYEAALKRASGAAQAWSKDLKQIGTQATQVGTALTKTITLPIVGLAAASVKAAMDFESSFANVGKTVDGVSDKSGKLTKAGQQLAQSFRQMAKEIPKTTDELTAIAALGGQMGVPIQALEKFTRHVSALGVAVDGISAEQAAAGLAQIANVFGDKEVKNVDKMSSALVNLGNSSNATEGDILEFSKRLAGAGNAAGLSVPEVMALGTAMANVGLNAEAGGTAMSTMIAKMSMAVSVGGEKLDAFAKVARMSAEEFSATWRRSPIEAIDAVVKGLSFAKSSGQDLNLVVKEIGATNIRTADTMKRLAGAGDGVSASLKIANEGWQTGNKHLEEAEKKYATTANQLKILWNSVKDIGITLGNAMLPAIKSATGALQAMLPIVDAVAHAFAMAPGPVQAIVVGLGLAVAAVGPLLYVFGQLVLSTSAVIGAFGKKGIATRLLASDQVALTASSGRLATALGLLGKAAAVAAAGFVGWQIGRVISDLFGLDQKIADTITHLDELKKARGETASGGQAGRAAVTEGLAQKERDLAEAIRDGNKALAARLQSEITAVKNDQTRLAMLDVLNKAIALGADKNITYAKAVEFLAQKEKERLAHIQETHDAQQRVVGSTQALTDKMDGLAAKLKQADKDIAELSTTARDKLAAALKSGAFEMKELEAASGLSEFAIKRFQSQIKESTKGTKAHDAAVNELASSMSTLTAAQIRQIEAELDLERTEATIAKALKVTVTQVREVADAQKRRMEIERDAAAERLAEHQREEKEADAEMDRFFKNRELEKSMREAADQEERRITLSSYDFQRTEIAKWITDEKLKVDQSVAGWEGAFTEIDRVGQAKFAALAAAESAQAMHMAADALRVETAWQRTLVKIPALVQQALTGGGGLRGAGSAIASSLGENLLGDIFAAKGKLGAAFGKIAEPLLDGVGKIFGKGIGMSLAAAMPGIGSAIGAVVGPLMGKIADKLFGGGTAGRDMIRKFWDEQFGGFENLQHRLEALGPQGLKLLDQLGRVGRGNTDQAKAAIEAINKAIADADAKAAQFNTTLGKLLGDLKSTGTGLPESLRNYLSELERGKRLTEDNLALFHQMLGQTEVDWKAVESAVQRYGGDLSKLGGSFQSARLHESWQQVIDDMDLFERGGIDAGEALDLTQGKIIELVNQSRRFGTEIPENMRPWIEKLIESGELVDENGEKITDIGKLTFGETLQTSLQNLTDQIKLLIDEFKKVPGAVAQIPTNVDTTVRVRRVYEDEDSGRVAPAASTGAFVTGSGLRYLASGGYGDVGHALTSFWKPRGTDTQPAMLTPGEVVMNEGQQGNVGHALDSAMQFVDSLKSELGGMFPTHQTAGWNQPIETTTIMKVNDRELGRAVAVVLPNELRRLGIRVRS